MADDVSEQTIQDRWTVFCADLENLCDELAREKPTVVAVTKTRSDDEIQAAIDLGIQNFGENYPQSFANRAAKFPEQNWHYIGHLQRNDAEDVVNHASVIHTLDRKKLTRRLLYFDFNGECFIQVNFSREASKSGIEYEKDKVEDLLNYSRNEGLNVTGLMGIGSLDWTTEETYEEFQRFVEFGQELGLNNMSLGMSGDWQQAVKAGSTHLRVGTAIFGPRQ